MSVRLVDCLKPIDSVPVAVCFGGLPQHDDGIDGDRAQVGSVLRRGNDLYIILKVDPIPHQPCFQVVEFESVVSSNTFRFPDKNRAPGLCRILHPAGDDCIFPFVIGISDRCIPVDLSEANIVRPRPGRPCRSAWPGRARDRNILARSGSAARPGRGGNRDDLETFGLVVPPEDHLAAGRAAEVKRVVADVGFPVGRNIGPPLGNIIVFEKFRSRLHDPAVMSVNLVDRLEPVDRLVVRVGFSVLVHVDHRAGREGDDVRGRGSPVADDLPTEVDSVPHLTVGVVVRFERVVGGVIVGVVRVGDELRFPRRFI